MRRKTALMLAFATAGSISALTSVSRGTTNFTDNFNTGDVTDGGLFSTGAITNAANVSFTEPVGGPLTITVANVPPTEGGYIQTAAGNAFDFTTAPLYAVLSAPIVNGVQQSLAPANGGGSSFTNNALTYLGVDVAGANEGTYTGASRVDSGIDKAYVAVNSANGVSFSLEYKNKTGPGLNTLINYTLYKSQVAIPSGPNIAVTSVFLYLDAVDAADGNIWLNFGATWENTTTDTFTTDYLEGGSANSSTSYLANLGATGDTDPISGMTAYDVGNPNGPYYGSPSLNVTQDNMIYSQFSGNTAGAVEVSDPNAAATGNAVEFGQLAVQVPEPASLGLIALGLPALLRRKRRQA